MSYTNQLSASTWILLCNSLLELPVGILWFLEPTAMLSPEPEEETLKPGMIMAIRSFSLAIFCLGVMSMYAAWTRDMRIHEFALRSLCIYHFAYGIMILFNGYNETVHYPVIGPSLPEDWKQFLRDEYGIWVNYWEHQVKVILGSSLHLILAIFMVIYARPRTAISKKVR